jgi:TonB-linked SusC/RagA family outer membrane protein
MRKILLLSTVMMFFAFTVMAQKTVTGVVSDDSGIPLPGATIVEQNTSNGVSSDFDGNFTINIAQGASLEISFVGYETLILVTNDADNYNVSLAEGNQLEEVVVTTALGLTRTKKSLGYATQTVDGDDIADVKSTNIFDALSGEVAGLDIKSSGTLGGSTNIIVRGFSSVTGNNQALIVIDGTPLINGTGNTSGQTTGRGGYDYGNAASDINPDDIASMEVLKGGAATALYGSRASNGAIVINTKRGSKRTKGAGITITSSVMMGTADAETLPRYQNEYGSGYGQYGDAGPDNYFFNFDVNGDGIANELIVSLGDDASFGAKFDPSLQVYGWESTFPGLSTYKQSRAYVAPNSVATDFLKNSLSVSNSVAFESGTETSSFRMSYTNNKQQGILPNSEINKNTISLRTSQKYYDKLTIAGGITIVKTEGLGRYGTGYDNRNPFQSFRQWWAVNVDILEQKSAYELDGKNRSWNTYTFDDTRPHYFDNPYWVRYNAYNTDERNRYIGNTSLSYEVNDDITILGRVTFDSFDEIREERINLGSTDVPLYKLYDRNQSEINYDLIASFDKDINEDINIEGNVGVTLRVNKTNLFVGQTNGGLIAADLFNFDNSASPLTPNDVVNYDATSKVDGKFIRASIGFKDTFFLEGSARQDRSSTLPKDNNSYFYSSVAGTFIFSELLDLPWLTFGKLRANYASVGSDTTPYNVFNSYTVVAPFGGNAAASNPSAFNNAALKAETTKDTEFGVELRLFKSLNFDISFYDRLTEDLITPVSVSRASGASSLYLNSGSVSNKGVEIVASTLIIEKEDFDWGISLNYSKNTSLIESLAPGIDYLELASVQGGVSIGAKVGEPYGIIRGQDFVYEGGRKVITSAGYYQRSAASNEVIGDTNPDYTAGVKNKIRYKNFKLSFLIDIQKGGDIFSLDTYYGYATGIYDQSVGNNHLGNPIRNSIANGGGRLLDGVQAGGAENTVIGRADYYANGLGYARAPKALHVYDGSFVKLRELSLSYNVPESYLSKTPIQSATVALNGRNLWIISKNMPYSDPESGLSAGNVQGYQSGAYPAIKEFGATLNIKF